VNVLLLTQVLPYPLDAGAKVRAYYVIRHLAQSHAITLVSFVRASDRLAAVEHLGQFCREIHTEFMPRSRAWDGWHLVRSAVDNSPFLIARDWVPAMAKTINRQLARTRFDAVHADQLWMAPYALLADKRPRDRGRLQLVLDQHNAVYKVPTRMAETEPSLVKRVLMKLEARKLARYEAEICQRFDRVVWVTCEDHQALQDYGSGHGLKIRNSAVIPICGDPKGTPMVTHKESARRVTFVGGLHYPPNAQGVQWLVERVFPQILAQVPDAVLTVIGKHPSRGIAYLASSIPARNLEVAGYVANLTPYLEETCAFVVPLMAGGGMRVKIVDAWTWGLPVVSTSVGAEGIETRPGENILIADTPEAFSQAVVRLLRDPSLARQVGIEGRRGAEARYDWHTAYRAWDTIYASEQ
jgi:glycosyltransferase involved in cell wall biosynthesis